MNQTISLLLLVLTATSCISPSGDTPAEKVSCALQMRDEVLTEFASREPAASKRLEVAAGYVAFRGFHIHPGFMTFGNGYYVVVDNVTHQAYHGKFKRLAVGPGIAIKMWDGVVIVEDQKALETLSKDGLAAGYLIEAAFKFGSFGGSSSLFGPLGSEAYLWTETGFALEAAYGPAWYTEDEELNKAQAAP